MILAGPELAGRTGSTGGGGGAPTARVPEQASAEAPEDLPHGVVEDAANAR
jgi:hypothetical protein